MSYAVKIFLKDEYIEFNKIEWKDSYDADMILKTLEAESLDAQSLTENIDVWVDGIGALKKENYIIGIRVNDIDYNFVGNALLLGLDYDSGETKALTDQEIKWISKNVQISAKPVGYIK